MRTAKHGRAAFALLLAVAAVQLLGGPAGAAAASSASSKDRLLFLNSKTNTVLVTDTAGKHIFKKVIAPPELTTVYPGAVSADGKLAFHPATRNKDPSAAAIIVTNLHTGSVTMATLPDSDLSGCTFFNISNKFENFNGAGIPGTYVAAGAPSARGGSYPLSYALGCGSTEYLFVARYHNGKIRFPSSKTARYVFPVLTEGASFGHSKSHLPAGSGGNAVAETLAIDHDTTYVIARVSVVTAGSSAFDLAAVYKAVTYPKPRFVKLTRGFIDSFQFAGTCYDFEFLTPPGPHSRLVAACALKGPGSTQAVWHSGAPKVNGLDTENDFNYVNATVVNNGIYDSLAPKVGSGTRPVYGVTVVGKAGRPAVKRTTVPAGNAKLHQKTLFSLPPYYGDVILVPSA